MKRFEQINVIPFIDIMLVLLAIVLTTSSFISSGLIDVDLPEAETATTPSQEETTEISIDADNSIYLKEKKLNLEELSSELQQFDRTTAFILRVDKSVPFEQFISIIDILKKYQLNNLSIMTHEAHAAR